MSCCPGCKPNKPDGNVIVRNEYPSVFPDYKEVTIPLNIVPLNFRVEGNPDKCYVKISGKNGDQIECSGENKIIIPEKTWKRIKQQNVGSFLEIKLSSKSKGQWTT